MTARDFYRRTGMPDRHVLFGQTRPDKRVHCENLNPTHFVDDYLESTPPSAEPWTTGMIIGQGSKINGDANL